MPLLPRLTVNRLFITDLMAAQPPCFALGYVEEHGEVSGFMAVRPAVAIPQTSTDRGFRFGHCVLGNDAYQLLQFTFEFYGHATYHGLVNPSNPIVQAVITRMLATEDYFFFAINPDQTVTAFRSRLEGGDLAGLRANQERFKTPTAHLRSMSGRLWRLPKSPIHLARSWTGCAGITGTT